MSIRIYDMNTRFVAHPVALRYPTGQRMEVDRLEYASPSRYEALWDGTNELGELVGQGIYFAQLTVPGAEPLMVKMYVLGRKEMQAVDSSRTATD